LGGISRYPPPRRYAPVRDSWWTSFYGPNRRIVLTKLFMRLLTLLYSISLDVYACDVVTKKRKFSNISPIITVFDIIPPGSHNPAGIPGLEIPQSRIRD